MVEQLPGGERLSGENAPFQGWSPEEVGIDQMAQNFEALDDSRPLTAEMR
jgi:hypothetical protein